MLLDVLKKGGWNFESFKFVVWRVWVDEFFVVWRSNKFLSGLTFNYWHLLDLIRIRNNSKTKCLKNSFAVFCKHPAIMIDNKSPTSVEYLSIFDVQNWHITSVKFSTLPCSTFFPFSLWYFYIQTDFGMGNLLVELFQKPSARRHNVTPETETLERLTFLIFWFPGKHCE